MKIFALLVVAASLAACHAPADPSTDERTGVEAPLPTSTTALARARATHFGATGTFSTDARPGLAGGDDDRFFAAAVDASGRFVAVGTSAKRGRGGAAIVARFLLDGTLDRSFGRDGVVVGPTDDVDASFDHGDIATDAFYGVRVDAKGRIVAVGRAGLGGRGRTLIARYLPSGALDRTFGDLDGRGPARRGWVLGMGDEYLDDHYSGVPPESSWPDERFHAVDLDSKGRIVVAGAAADLNASWLSKTSACHSFLPAFLCRRGFYKTLVARFTPEGRLDTTFATIGYVTGTASHGHWWTGRHDELDDVRVLADDAIVAVGFAGGATREDEPTETRALLVMLERDGRFAEDRFNTADTPGHVLGPVRSRAGGAREELHSIAVDAQAKLVVSGLSWDASGAPRVLVARHLANGVVDPSFAEAGYVLEETSGPRPSVRAALDEQGLIVVSAPPHLRRYAASGANDDAFRAPPFDPDTTANELVVDRLGKVWVAGTRGKGLFIARYQRSGCLDRPGECPAR